MNHSNRKLIMLMNMAILSLILGSVLAVLAALVLEFFIFSVDYSRTEIVQFEDDEYYYYVKAVPKNILSTPDKKVKRINKQRKKTPVKQEKHVTTIKTAHGVSRTTVKQDEEKKKERDRTK